MDFYTRRQESAWRVARGELASFLGAEEQRLTLVDNATYAMNIVANGFPLAAGDEVLATDHVYGAVRRIWQRACERQGAAWRELQLPAAIESAEQVADCVISSFTDSTRLLVISHITSATALLLPLKPIIAAAQARDIAVCIDGPHAVAQVDLSLDELGCDFYCASCHKWLAAPLGSGFLYARDRWAPVMLPPIQSWGRLDAGDPEQWADEFIWQGTRDATAALCLPEAISFLRDTTTLRHFRQHARELCDYSFAQLKELHPQPPLSADREMYLAMAHAPLPPGPARPLQQALWERCQIEVPIIDFDGRRWVRVSCHLYNSQQQVDDLCQALRRLLAEGL